MQNVNPIILKEGQPFFDEAVYVTVSVGKQLALEINAMFQDWWMDWLRPTPLANVLSGTFPNGRDLPRLPVPLAPPNPRVEIRIEEEVGTERVRLNWLKPGPDGILIPKEFR